LLKEITGKYAIKMRQSMHTSETKTEKEVKILCNKPSEETNSMKANA
jgi:hypothetical protein